MKEEDSYIGITRDRYQNIELATSYHEGQFGPFTFKNARHIAIASREIHLLRRALATLAPRPSRVLDLPCGTGKLAELFAEFKFLTVGADISSEMLEILKLKEKAGVAFHGLVRTDALSLPFPDNTFDTLVCLRLLHRVPDSIRSAMLREFVRVSRQYVLVSIGVSDGIQRLRLRLRNAFSDDLSVPFPISMHDFRLQLGDAGLIPLRSWSILPALSSEMLILATRDT